MSTDLYRKRHDALGMDPISWERELKEDLVSQLCCAWEEIAEQHREADESLPAVLKAVAHVHFDENHIVLVGKDHSIQHFKFILERVV